MANGLINRIESPTPTSLTPSYNRQRLQRIVYPKYITLFNRRNKALDFLSHFSQNQETYQQLENLNLGENGLDDSNLATIIEQLIANTELRLLSLDLGGNRFSDAGARRLLMALEFRDLVDHHKLICCNLNGNTEINDNTLEEIAAILAGNHSALAPNPQGRRNSF